MFSNKFDSFFSFYNFIGDSLALALQFGMVHFFVSLEVFPFIFCLLKLVNFLILFAQKQMKNFPGTPQPGGPALRRGPPRSGGDP